MNMSVFMYKTNGGNAFPSAVVEAYQKRYDLITIPTISSGVNDTYVERTVESMNNGHVIFREYTCRETMIHHIAPWMSKRLDGVQLCILVRARTGCRVWGNNGETFVKTLQAVASITNLDSSPSCSSDFSGISNTSFKIEYFEPDNCIALCFPSKYPVSLFTVSTLIALLNMPSFTTFINSGTWSDKGDLVFGDLTIPANIYRRYARGYYKVLGIETIVPMILERLPYEAEEMANLGEEVIGTALYMHLLAKSRNTGEGTYYPIMITPLASDAAFYEGFNGPGELCNRLVGKISVTEINTFAIQQQKSLEVLQKSGHCYRARGVSILHEYIKSFLESRKESA